VANNIDREIRRFGHRVRVGRFVGAFTQALAALTLCTATGLLVLHLLGHPWRPSPLWPQVAWLALLLVPALLWGAVAARRIGFGRKQSAVHLDRRLGMDGLLITALEMDTAEYRDRLLTQLETAEAALPRIRARPLVLRLAVASIILTSVLLLPVPRLDATTPNPLGAEALEAFEAKLEALEEEGALDAEVREEIGERFQALKSGFERDGQVEWTDLDALERQMEHERTLEVARLAKAMQDLEAFARGEDAATQAGAAAAAERMSTLLNQASDAGLLDKLPPGLLQRLGAFEPSAGEGKGAEGTGQGIDASGLDADTLKQLAAALAESAGDELEALEAGELLDDLELADLSEFLKGEACRLCEGKPSDDCPG
jgi:hypothetical protein